MNMPNINKRMPPPHFKISCSIPSLPLFHKKFILIAPIIASIAPKEYKTLINELRFIGIEEF